MLSWREKREGPAIVLKLQGEFDLEEAPAVRSILEAKAKDRCRYLVLDFTGVQFIDSSGIATLIGYHKSASDFGGSFALVGVRPAIMNVFNLVSLGTFFPIYETVEEALAKYREANP